MRDTVRSTVKSSYQAFKSATGNIRWLSLCLITIALIMLPWLIVLGATLKGTSEVRMWSSTWIGLDCLEIIGLVVTAILIVKRKIMVIMAATFTATLFLIDAWFDIMLSQAGFDWGQALLVALLFEIPIVIVCICIAITAPAWCADTNAIDTASKHLKTIQALMHKALHKRVRK